MLVTATHAKESRQPAETELKKGFSRSMLPLTMPARDELGHFDLCVGSSGHS